MNFDAIARQYQSLFRTLNLPATDEDLAQLENAFGQLPEEVTGLYLGQNGASSLDLAAGGHGPARLMSVQEAVKTHSALPKQYVDIPQMGVVAWLWSDDGSNYAGVYTESPLRGWVAILDHDEPLVVPAFRSVASFLAAFISSVTNGDDSVDGLPSLHRELPETAAHPESLNGDRTLSVQFAEMYHREQNLALRQTYAACAISLTPYEDTNGVLQFFADEDMFTPERAIKLLEFRRWPGAVDQLELLARKGKPNGDSAAMRWLARMGTEESAQAIVRLRSFLQGQKRQILDRYLNPRFPVPDPRWP